MSEENTIAAGEFKAKCLKIMADVERASQELVITKRGKPLVKIVPYIADDEPESKFGCMQASAFLQDAEMSDSYENDEEKSQVDENHHELEDFIADEEEDIDITEAEEETAEGEAENAGSADHRDIKKPLPISRTPPPNRGLPIDSPSNHRHGTDIKSHSAFVQASEDDGLYVPSIEDEEDGYDSDIDENDDLLDFDDDDDDFFFIDEEEEDIEDNHELQSELSDDDYYESQESRDVPLADENNNDQDDLRNQLSAQFTSAWNRNSKNDDGETQ